MTVAVGEVETKDHWEIVIELTNDDGSRTEITVGCRTLDDDEWEVVKPTGLPRSVGMLLRIPSKYARGLYYGLGFASIWCL